MLGRYAQFTGAVSNLHKAIQKIERDEMTRYGLKGPHVQCLLEMSKRLDGVTAAELSQLCGKDKAAVSRDLAELEQAGMVVREGGYRAACYLTEQGLRTALDIQKTAALAVDLAGRGLTERDREIFYRSLGLIEANLDLLSREGLPGKEENENTV